MINKFPVILLANYRTGSTALAKNIAATNSLRCYLEPFHNENIDSIDSHKKQFIAYSLSRPDDKNFLVKFMPSQISFFNNYNELLSKLNFLIKLKRRNKVNQIASLYVAEKRNKFFKLVGEDTNQYSLEIDRSQLIRISNDILRNDFLIDTLPYQSDIDLVYEDLGFIHGTDQLLTDQPKNIEEIKHEIKNILDLTWDNLKSKYKS